MKEYTVPSVLSDPTVGEQEPHGVYSPTVGSERKTVRFIFLETIYQLTANGINIPSNESKLVRLRLRPGCPESRTTERLKELNK